MRAGLAHWKGQGISSLLLPPALLLAGPLGKHSPSLFASAHTLQLISFRPTDLLIRARELLHPVVVVFWAETFRVAGQSVRGCMLGSHLAGAHRKEDRRGRPSVGIKLSSGLLLNKPFGREQS